MRLLLDTHAVLWWFNGNPSLSTTVQSAIEDEANQVFVSAVSAMEVTTKHRIGKLPEADILASYFLEMVDHEGFFALPIDLKHGAMAGRLSIAHRDPFDRLLIAQAILENLVFASNEKLFDQTAINRLW